MIHQLDLNGNDKVDKAIMRLKAYEPPEECSQCSEYYSNNWQRKVTA